MANSANDNLRVDLMPVHITGEGPEAMEWVPKWQARDMELSLTRRIQELQDSIKDCWIRSLRP